MNLNAIENDDVFGDDYMTEKKEEPQPSTKKRWESRDTDLQDEMIKSQIPPTKDRDEFTT